jgi:hypothetical protein
VGDIGRVLVVAGGLLLLAGLVLIVAGKIPLLGRLPGDIVYRKGSFTFYFPLATSILLSLLVTAVLTFFRR